MNMAYLFMNIVILLLIMIIIQNLAVLPKDSKLLLTRRHLGYWEISIY